jgi:hypothetical protein
MSLKFAIRVNTLWFSSLVFSLTAASVGILCKQWIRDYVSHAGSSPRDTARIRQYRYNGIAGYHIHEVIAFLPVLLEWSMGFFFIGLVDLLWQLNDIVAAIVTCFVSASLASLIVTTILPVFKHDSPHRSPQALAAYLLHKNAVRLLAWLAFKITGPGGLDERPWPLYVPLSLFKHRWRVILGWLRRLLIERRHTNWRERERYYMSQQESQLDCQILAGADALYMDNTILEEVIRPCIQEVPASDAARCIASIVANRAHGMVDGMPFWMTSAAIDRGVPSLVHLVLDVLPRMPTSAEAEILEMLQVLERLCHALPFEQDDADLTKLFEQVYTALSPFLTYNDPVSRRAFLSLYHLFPRARPSAHVSPAGESWVALSVAPI